MIMDKINDVTAGLFAGMLSSAVVTGIIIPVAVAMIVIVAGHFVRRYLNHKYPIKK